MRDLTKSILSFSWVMSLFGLRQMGAVLSPGTGTTSAFDSVARSAEGQLGSLLRSTFRAGDNLQRSMVDMMFGFLSLGGWDPSSMMRMGADMANRTAQAGVGAMQGSAQAAGQAAQAAAATAAGMGMGSGWPPSAGGAQPFGAQPPGAQASAGWGPMPPTGA